MAEKSLVARYNSRSRINMKILKKKMKKARNKALTRQARKARIPIDHRNPEPEPERTTLLNRKGLGILATINDSTRTTNQSPPKQQPGPSTNS